MDTFCSHSSIYRIVRAYRAGTLVFLRNAEGQLRSQRGWPACL